MYVEIRDNKLLSWCENPYMDYEFVDIEYSTFDSEKYIVVDGKLKDISNTDEYKAVHKTKENRLKKAELQMQIDELDKKRIRAIAEPQLKDAISDQTWLDFYTLQIQELRAIIAIL